MRRLVPLVLALLLVAVVPAEAKHVALGVKGVAFCSTKPVNVRLTDGSIVARRHVVPGRRVRTVVKASKDLLLFVRIKAPWSTVQRGQTIRVLADGPAGEQWEWRFGTRNKKPLRDPTPYQACLRLNTRTGKFVRHMKNSPGTWRFTVRIVAGSLVSSTGGVTIASR